MDNAGDYPARPIQQRPLTAEERYELAILDSMEERTVGEEDRFQRLNTRRPQAQAAQDRDLTDRLRERHALSEDERFELAILESNPTRNRDEEERYQELRRAIPNRQDEVGPTPAPAPARTMEDRIADRSHLSYEERFELALLESNPARSADDEERYNELRGAIPDRQTEVVIPPLPALTASRTMGDRIADRSHLTDEERFELAILESNPARSADEENRFQELRGAIPQRNTTSTADPMDLDEPGGQDSHPIPAIEALEDPTLAGRLTAYLETEQIQAIMGNPDAIDPAEAYMAHVVHCPTSQIQEDLDEIICAFMDKLGAGPLSIVFDVDNTLIAREDHFRDPRNEGEARLTNIQWPVILEALHNDGHEINLVTARRTDEAETAIADLEASGLIQGVHYDEIVATHAQTKEAFVERFRMGRPVLFLDDDLSNSLPVAKHFVENQWPILSVNVNTEENFNDINTRMTAEMIARGEI